MNYLITGPQGSGKSSVAMGLHHGHFRVVPLDRALGHFGLSFLARPLRGVPYMTVVAEAEETLLDFDWPELREFVALFDPEGPMAFKVDCQRQEPVLVPRPRLILVGTAYRGTPPTHFTRIEVDR